MATPAAAPTADSAAAPGTKSERMLAGAFHAGPNPPAAESDASAAESAGGPPPAARLYRHALESVFAFLFRRELALALRVSRGWLAAVRSMRRLELHITLRQPTAPLDQLAQSAMSRHVAVLGGHGCGNMRLDADALSIVARLMPHLRGLLCQLALPPLSQPPSLSFPAALRQLAVHMPGHGPGPADATQINAVIAAVGRLSLLEEVNVTLKSLDPLVSFAPLAALPQLLGLKISV